MQTDIILVAGLLLAALAIPAAVSAFSDGRRPRVATLVLLAGGGMIIYALTSRPGGYTLAGIPEAIARVVALFVH